MSTLQYARKGANTMDNLWSRQLTFDYHRSTGTPFFHIDFDARNCYDRFVPEIASLASVRMGTHPSNAQWITQLLQSFRHRIIIQGELSKSFYEDTNLIRVLGIGQGMGWSPTLWGLVNDITIRVMNKHSPGQLLTSPLTRDEIFSSLEAYVDDVHGGVNLTGTRKYNEENNEKLDLTDSILLYLYKYERYLRASGGAFSRASVYNLSLQPFTSPPIFHANQQSLQVTDPYSMECKDIPMLSPSTPTKILGVWLQPDNDQRRQLLYIQEKAQAWVNTFGYSHLPQYYKLLSFQTRLIPQLDYSSPIVLFKKKQFHDLSKLFLPVLKHALGLSKSYPNDLLFLNKSFGGYGIKNLWLRSITTKMEFLTKHVRLNDVVGQKIKLMIEQHQFEAGTSYNIFPSE